MSNPVIKLLENLVPTSWSHRYNMDITQTGSQHQTDYQIEYRQLMFR